MASPTNSPEPDVFGHIDQDIECAEVLASLSACGDSDPAGDQNLPLPSDAADECDSHPSPGTSTGRIHEDHPSEDTTSLCDDKENHPPSLQERVLRRGTRCVLTVTGAGQDFRSENIIWQSDHNTDGHRTLHFSFAVDHAEVGIALDISQVESLTRAFPGSGCHIRKGLRNNRRTRRSLYTRGGRPGGAGKL